MVELIELSREARTHGAGELLLMAGDMPAFRSQQWQRLERQRLAPEDLERMVRAMLPPDAWKNLQARRELEIDCWLDEPARCHIHFQRGTLVIHLRFTDCPRTA